MELLDLTASSFDEVLANPRVLVYFWSEKCRPCRNVAPVIFELAEEYEGLITVANVNTEIERDLLKRFNIMTVPTVILFEGGKESKRITGAQSKEEYQAEL